MRDASAGNQSLPTKEDAAAETVLDSSIPSELLLKGEREVQIRHAGETYRLRLTKNDKLILHK